MKYLEILKLISNAPKNLKGFNELFAYARNAYKQIMGVFPEGIDNIAVKRAANQAVEDRSKVVQFPGGGKDKIDPFTPRSEDKISKRSLDIAKELEELTNKNLADRGLGSIKLGDDLPPPKNKKPAVDPKLKKSEDIKKEFRDFENRNKKGELFNLSGQKGNFLTEDEFLTELDSLKMNFIQNSPGFNLQLIPQLKKPGFKAYNPFPNEKGDKFLTDNQRQTVLNNLENVMKNEEYQIRYADNFADLMQDGDKTIEFAPNMFKIDPPQKADGGRIGFGSGGITGAGFAGNQAEQSQPQPDNQPMEMPPNLGFQPIFPMPQRNIPGSGGIKELKQLLQAVGAPELGMGYNFPVGDRGILGVGIAPSGNVGMQFRKQFKDGSKPTSPGRRNFIKMMAGLASLPVVGKLFKGAKVAEKVVQLKNTATTMPTWFPQFVDRFISKGIGKKVDADLMEYKNPDLPNIKVTRHDDGRTLVEGNNQYNEGYAIDYKPPGYEVIDPVKGKAVKTKGEFEAVEGRHVALSPEDYDTDAFYVDDLDELTTIDVAEMEKYSTGKVTKTVKDAFGEDTGVKKGVRNYDMDVGRAENEADVLRDANLLDNDYAKGGLAYMLGE